MTHPTPGTPATHPKPGDPIWVDLYTADPDAAIAFYTELFGWTAERAGEEFGGYITFRKDGKAVGGGMGRMEGDTESPDQWTIYLNSPDARATAAKATAHGGTVVLEPMDVGELGSMAVLSDPGGAGIGIWQPGLHQGFETAALVEEGKWADADGAPSWFELHTREYQASLDFYRDVFGWDDIFAMPEAPGFRYSTIHSTSPMLGGVMDASEFLPEGAPAAWSVYFGSGDVDKSVARVVELGGTVVSPAMDTPYGRMATVADVTGARFNLGGDAA